MCYHKLFIFTLCGHSCTSFAPLTKRCPPCSASLSSPHGENPVSPVSTSPSPAVDLISSRLRDGIGPSAWELEVSQYLKNDSLLIQARNRPKPDTRRGATATCSIHQTHPYRTYFVHKLCERCSSARAHRLARLEAVSIKSELECETLRRRQRTKAEQQLRRTFDSIRSRPAALVAMRTAAVLEQTENRELAAQQQKKKSLSSIVTMAVSPTHGSEVHGGNDSSGSGSGGWLRSPKFKRPLSFGLRLAGKRKDDGGRHEDRESLSPEHFAVPLLLHDSFESLTTDGATSRKGNGDNRMDDSG